MTTQTHAGRTDQEIVDQTEALAVWLLSWAFNHKPETTTPIRDSAHPFAERCWSAACHIQEMLTDTDPENAVAELDGAPATSKRESLTDEMVVAAARSLNKRAAQACNVDEADSWNLYGDEYIEDARAALEAAHSIKENT